MTLVHAFYFHTPYGGVYCLFAAVWRVTQISQKSLAVRCLHFVLLKEAVVFFLAALIMLCISGKDFKIRFQNCNRL